MKIFSSFFHIQNPTYPKPNFQIIIKTLTTTCSSSSNLEIPTISSNPFLCLLNLCKTLPSIQQIHALLTTTGNSQTPLLKSKLLASYGFLGRVNIARQLFDEIPHPHYDSCKLMIRWYFINDMYSQLIGFYKSRRGTFLCGDDIVLSIVLKACTELRDLREGRRLHCFVVHLGCDDSFVLTGLADMYAKCGEIETARKVFERIRDRNVVCWTSMIVGYVRNGCGREALILFNRMRDCLVEGNAYTLGSLVTGCAKLGALHQGKWVHGYVIKNGISFLNSVLFTSLLDMYVKCGDVHDARLIFDEFCVVDLVSWTAMIVGYTQRGFAEEALLLFVDEKWRDVYHNSVTLASVLSACGQLGNLGMGSSVHGVGIKLGQEDGNVMNALLDMYSKCRRIEDAVCLFESMVDKDIVSWNSVIGGYAQNGFAYNALKSFNRMRSNGVRPDQVAIVAVLSACASLGDIRFGSALHGLSIKEGFLAYDSVHIGTALLNLYAKCGDANSARSVFDGMIEKNAVTWNAMIGGYGKQGDTNECLKLFNDMIKENVGPTDIVFGIVLSACSHTGMVKEGWKYFDEMCNKYDFTPSTRHYVCMVDLLARSGSLEEALEFIEKMPIDPDCTVFGAFLNGCEIHSRFDLGDVVVRKMLELNPDDAGHYVLMSRYNASKGRWGQSDHLRELMKTRGLKKQLGSSQVELYIDETYPQRASSCG